ncbi:MAG TPA: helix-turn-helix transcriptional regulator, partial [Ktedonobacteraceae bacterium]|nr:helix-turn-helix transcriptional regulator [Ktedonobacteraceae bacterium]
MEKKQTRGSKSRSRPVYEKSVPFVKDLQTETLIQESGNYNAPEEYVQQAEIADTQLDGSLPQNGRAGAFSILLGALLKNERNEILRVAREIGVSDNTVYRWLNGTSAPRYSHMQRLVELLTPLSAPSQPAHQHNGRSTESLIGHWDVQRELYRRVLEQAATTADDNSRRWHIIETIFEQALLLLDPDRAGLALTYARLMPPRADGYIHSLYEAEMRGQAPWPFALEFKTYLGSTTLAGASAMSQRVRIWNRNDSEARIPVGLDENEHSSCAAPVMRGGRLAGVLIVSSTLADFVNHPGVPRAVG